MTMSDTILTTRNATVADLVALLQAQHAAKLDVVAPARHLAADNGRLRLIGVGEPRLTPDGVTVGETVLRPTVTADAARATGSSEIGDFELGERLAQGRGGRVCRRSVPLAEKRVGR